MHNYHRSKALEQKVHVVTPSASEWRPHDKKSEVRIFIGPVGFAGAEVENAME